MSPLYSASEIFNFPLKIVGNEFSPRPTNIIINHTIISNLPSIFFNLKGIFTSIIPFDPHNRWEGQLLLPLSQVTEKSAVPRNSPSKEQSWTLKQICIITNPMPFSTYALTVLTKEGDKTMNQLSKFLSDKLPSWDSKLLEKKWTLVNLTVSILKYNGTRSCPSFYKSYDQWWKKYHTIPW
jgi:hypothetical protein